MKILKKEEKHKWLLCVNVYKKEVFKLMKNNSEKLVTQNY
jgi:hypothetical protein